MVRIHVLLLLMIPCLWATEAPLNMISYNVRNDNAGDTGPRNWADRKDTLAGYLLDRKASIIGLQEVKHKQLLDLDEALPDHTPVGVGRDDGKTAGEYSPIFFDRTIWKLDPQDHGTRQMRSSSQWKATLVPGGRIDHIFTAPAIRTATLTVESNGDAEGNAASDHHPVLLSIPDRSFKATGVTP